MMHMRRLALVVVLVGAFTGGAWAESITLASTTSTEQSGLFSHLLPKFKQASGVDVKVVAVGTGQALDIGRRGDADALLVHDQAAEERFVAEGFGIRRTPVMYNDFVLIGPKGDPVATRGSDIIAALSKISAGGAAFISRGDRSGTHNAENRYWEAAGLSSQRGSGYRSCGCGMGPALNMAAASNAYVLADRGTWLAFKNRGDLAILVEGDKRLFNQYGVIVVNPARHPHVKVMQAQRFADWIVSAAGQAAIADYKIDGEQLFFPSAPR
jgi:tungstate transport system substrate-binding protein